MAPQKKEFPRQAAADTLARLEQELTCGSYQEVEYARMVRDLQRVEQRLIKGEYYYSDFAGNTFNIPERTREYFIYFNSYFKAARTWAKVLHGVDVHRFAKIADLCPGWAPKLELALFYLRYNGTLILLDKDRAALEQNETFIGLFNPPYQVQSRVADIFEINEPPAELVLANHLIDDLLLNICAGEAGFDPNAIYQEEQAMKNAWALILQRRDYFFSKTVNQLSDLFLKLVQQGGSLILTQYQAYVEGLLDLNEAAAFCKEVARSLVERLTRRGFSSNRPLVEKCLCGGTGWFGADECFVLEAPPR